ncbi:MAG: endolytic transglycosylase MltG, partial [Polyangiaceae bacterium]
MAEQKKSPSKRPSADKSSGKRAKKSAEKKIAGTVVTLMLVVLAFVAGVLLVVYPARPAPGSGKLIAVDLAGNETPAALADELAAAGVITHPELFSAFVHLHASGEKIAAGTHVFTDALTPSEVLARVLRFGAGPKEKVTIPEGWNRFDIGKRLEAKGVCSAKRFVEASASPALLQTMRLDASSFEGFLFPATYELAEDSLAEDVVKTMKLEFDRRYQALADRNSAGILDLVQSLHFTEK